jgi:hypothetical protein
LGTSIPSVRLVKEADSVRGSAVMGIVADLLWPPQLFCTIRKHISTLETALLDEHQALINV